MNGRSDGLSATFEEDVEKIAEPRSVALVSPN